MYISHLKRAVCFRVGLLQTPAADLPQRAVTGALGCRSCHESIEHHQTGDSRHLTTKQGLPDQQHGVVSAQTIL